MNLCRGGAGAVLRRLPWGNPPINAADPFRCGKIIAIVPALSRTPGLGYLWSCPKPIVAAGQCNDRAIRQAA